MDYGIGIKRVKALLCLSLLVCALLLTVSCGDNSKNENESSDLLGMMNKIGEEITFDENMMDLSADDLKAFYGIDESEYKQFAAKINMSGVSSDEIIFVEAKDEKSAKVIKEKIENRYQTKLNETENYFPEEYKKIKSGGVMQKGNYVSMIVSDDFEKIKDIYENSFE